MRVATCWQCPRWIIQSMMCWQVMAMLHRYQCWPMDWGLWAVRKPSFHENHFLIAHWPFSFISSCGILVMVVPLHWWLSVCCSSSCLPQEFGTWCWSFASTRGSDDCVFLKAWWSNQASLAFCNKSGPSLATSGNGRCGEWFTIVFCSMAGSYGCWMAWFTTILLVSPTCG